jgi:hypothetical protein
VPNPAACIQCHDAIEYFTSTSTVHQAFVQCLDVNQNSAFPHRRFPLIVDLNEVPGIIINNIIITRRISDFSTSNYYGSPATP